jgi:hypothetical protein
MMSGRIPHALYLETRCTNGHVFPSVFDTLKCGADNAHQPPQGALFFLDYTVAQLAHIKSQVPQWQYELLEAMTVYGGYIGDTTGDFSNGNGGAGIVIRRHFEGPAAYDLAGQAYALGDWFLKFPHSDPSESKPLYCYQRPAGMTCLLGNYVGVPDETGPACPSTPCDVSKHMHMANPCVALGLAGKPGGCI